MLLDIPYRAILMVGVLSRSNLLQLRAIRGAILNNSIQQIKLHKGGYIIQIMLLAMFKHIALILERMNIYLPTLLQLLNQHIPLI